MQSKIDRPRCSFSSFVKLALGAGLLVTLTGCSDEAPEEAAVIRPAKLVRVMVSDDIQSLTFPAIIEASESTDLSFAVGGRIEELMVQEGDQIEADTLIARIDQRNYRNDLSTAQAQHSRAASDFDRAERLIGDGFVSRNDYEQRRADLAAARATLDNMRKNLDDTELRSPYEGVVAVVHTEVYQNVQAHEPIVTLQTTGGAVAAVEIPATLVANSGRIEPVETVVVLDAAPDVRIPAVFQSSETQADPSTQTFAVKFAFTPPADLVILPGMTGAIHSRLKIVRDDDPDGRIKIPLGSILSDGDTNFVWVVNETEMTVARRDIVLDEEIGDVLSVLDGLSAGDVIVGAGASYLHEGMQIRAYEP